MFTWKHVALAVISAVALYSCTSKAGSRESSRQAAKVSATNINSRKQAPDFTLTDENGRKVKLSDFRGKVVVLNFWATWCGPCELEIPWFVEFEQQYRSKGLEIVGVSMDEDGWQAIKPFIGQHRINYPVLLGNDSVGQLYGGVDSLPTTFIIDRDGTVAYPPHVGLADKSEYLGEIEALLDAKQQTARQQANAGRTPLRVLPSAVLFGAAK